VSIHVPSCSFTCHRSGEDPLQVVKGIYATAMNVDNPDLYQNVIFIKKVAVAFPEQKVGRYRGL